MTFVWCAKTVDGENKLAAKMKKISELCKQSCCTSLFPPCIHDDWSKESNPLHKTAYVNCPMSIGLCYLLK